MRIEFLTATHMNKNINASARSVPEVQKSSYSIKNILPKFNILKNKEITTLKTGTSRLIYFSRNMVFSPLKSNNQARLGRLRIEKFCSSLNKYVLMRHSSI